MTVTQLYKSMASFARMEVVGVIARREPNAVAHN